MSDFEVIEGSHLVMTSCSAPGCDVRVVCVPAHVRDAKCLECAMSAAGAADRWNLTVHPRFAGPGSDPRAYAPECVVEQSAVVVVEHPRPSVGSRDTWVGQYPSAVLKVAQRAREAGWDVRQQYARGCAVHGSTGRPLKEAASYALIFYSHPMTDAGAYAVYRGGTWGSVNIAGRLTGGVTDLLEWLEAGGQPPAGWWERLAQRLQDAQDMQAYVVRRNAALKAVDRKCAASDIMKLIEGMSAEAVLKVITPARGKKEGLS